MTHGFQASRSPGHSRDKAEGPDPVRSRPHRVRFAYDSPVTTSIRESPGEDTYRLPGGFRLDIPRAIYATILLTAVIVPLGEHPSTTPWEAFTGIAVSALVLWLAHGYAHLMAFRIHAERQLGAGELALALGRDLTILAVAVPPMVLMLLAILKVVPLGAAFDLAVWLAIVSLYGWGVAAAHAATLRGWRAWRSGLVDAMLGSAIVFAEIWAFH